MNKSEFIDALAAHTDSPKAQAARNVDAIVEIITAALKKGDKVAITGFGTFQVSKRAARTGRNPATGETIKIAASNAPKFAAGATLKDALNSGKSAAKPAAKAPAKPAAKKK